MQAVVDYAPSPYILGSMKLGLISDVHGDVLALDRAIDLLTHQHSIDAIWCAGDLVGRGKQPDEVIARLIRHDIPTVMGNHDEMMLTPQQSSSTGEVMLGQLLGYHPSTLRFLTTLPRTYRSHIDGHTLVMVHGTPRSNTESVSLNPTRVAQSLTWLEKIGADILVTGHTHTPMILRDGRGLIVNPGSLFNPLGFQRSSSETYGVLDVTQMNFQYYPLWD
jgi:putative phosphoesterase